MQRERWKILEVVEATAAGVGRHVADLASHIDLQRFDVHVAWSPTRSDERFRDAVKFLEGRGVHTHPLPMTRGVNPLSDIPALCKLISFIVRERFDLVHGHSSKAGFLSRLAARLARPSAVTVYSPNAIAIPLNRAYWYPEKAAGWLTDSLIAVSESERDELSAYSLVPSEKLVRVTSGIPIPDCDDPVPASIRQELGLPSDALVIGTVGRVSYQKDPETFLAAAESVVQSNPNVYFLWIGPGEDLKFMLEETSRRGLKERVRFIGYRKDALRLLEAVDIFVLTSRYESFGYVTCEAMVLGKPVVASRVNGSREVVDHDVTGFLLPSGDAAGFAGALQRLLDDPALRREFGAAGRRRVETHFSLPRMVAETEQLYLKLLDAKNSKIRRPNSLPHSMEAK